MIEPGVALTDFLLTLECAVFAVLLWHRGKTHPAIRPWFVLFFAATALSSLTGGLVHGFFLDAASQTYRVLWPATLIGIVIASLAAWSAGARMLFSGRTSLVTMRAAMTAACGFALAVLIGIQEFWIAILAYLPASLLLLAAFLKAAVRSRDPAPAWAAAGIALTFFGGAVQQFEVALHPVYLTHNALYHLILAAALCLIFIGVSWLALPRTPVEVVEHDDAA
jgi:hypothetical protein